MRAILLALALAGQAPSRRPVIAIDPGHPSETSAGDAVEHGATEVHVAWAVARRLARLLRARGYVVVMTKAAERDFVRNRDRARIANEAGAALLVRLHCDASADSGFALYYPDRQGTAEGRTGPSEEVIRASRAAADSLHAGMAAALDGVLKDGGVRGDSKTFVGARQGALTGSIFSEVPVVTVEMVVLTNAHDARFITAARGERRMAEAIAAGIERYMRGRD
jgi:N-acetylmuramoyl-L-alanine amidase